MMVQKRIQEKSRESSLFSIIGFKYLPYWPLFALLSLILLSSAFIYSRYITPVYKVTARIIINDEQKGVQESETLRSLNMYAENKIVENEVEVLKSRSLMHDVVLNLHLYAPMFEKGRVKSVSAYVTSPVMIQAKDPTLLKAQEKVAFEFNEQAGAIKVLGRNVRLGEWASFPFGTIQFVKNPNQKGVSVREMYFSLVDPKLVALGMGNNLEVGAGSKLSSVVNVEYTDEVSERGVHVVNQLLESYSRASIENNNRLAANTLAFITERIRDVEGELDSIEQSIQQFRTTQGVVDISQQGRLYLESVADNDRKASDINMQLAVLDQVERYVRYGDNRTGLVPTTLGISDPVLTDLLQNLNDLELQRTNLSTRVGEENPLVKSVENEIQKIRPNILDIVRSQRSRLQASLSNYNRSSNQLNSTLRSLPQKERQLVDISRQQDVKNSVYSFLLQRREEAELSNASTISDSRVVDRAEASINPVNSKKMIMLVGALIAAFALGITYVFLKEGMTSKILFHSDIRKATAITIVGEIVFRKFKKRAPVSLTSDPVLTSHLHQLEAALGLYDEQQTRKKILVTSSISNEGKTFVSNHLAASLATAEKKVVLVDLNLYQPETSKRNNIEHHKGIADFIQGTSALTDIVNKTGTPYLDIIPSGVRTKNPAALLLNNKLSDLFHQLEMQYDFIIIDSPATEFTTDAYMLSRYADLTLYIIRHGMTPNTIVQKLDGNIKLRSMKELAIVFNGVKSRGFLRRYYGYGYGYGYENVFTKKAYVSAG